MIKLSMMKNTKIYTVVFMLIFALTLYGCGANNVEAVPLARNVVFDVYVDDQLVQVIGINEDEALSLNNPQVRTGYVFKGWLNQGASFDPLNWEFAEKIRLDAAFELIEYRLNYDLDETMTVPQNPSSMTIEDVVDLGPALKSGYDFKGWYLDPEFTQEISQLSKVKEDLVLYPRFERTIQVASITSLQKEAINIDFRANQGRFIDHRYSMEKGMFWESYYYGYYADGQVVEFHFKNTHIIYKTIESAYLYGRMLGWLPESLRSLVETIEIASPAQRSIRYSTSRNLDVYVDFEDDFFIDRPVFGTFVDTLLGVYYRQLTPEEIATYASLVEDSGFRISLQAKDSTYQDFLESYIYYLMMKNLEDSGQFQWSTYAPEMASRIQFFESHQLGIEHYAADTIRSVESSMRKDTALFHGTVWDLPMLFGENDPNTFESITYMGQGLRMTYDHRDAPEGWKYRSNHLFNATYSNGSTIEFQMSTEFEDFDELSELALAYAYDLGRLPEIMFKQLKTYSVFNAPFVAGGGSNNIVVGHNLNDPITQNIALTELNLHEAAHVSLDWDSGGVIQESRWLKAASDDNYYIAHYAENFPLREDIAETISVYLLFRYRPDRIQPELIEMFRRLIPNRIAYFDEFDFSFPE